MTDEWLAGFFDGEGCISGQMQFRIYKYIKHPRVIVQISITQKDRNILEQIRVKYGGTIHNKVDKSKAYQIRWTGKQDMIKILRILAPHCIAKKEQILLALRFCDTLREDNLGCVPLDEGVHLVRKEIYNDLKIAKGYGHTVS